MNFFKKVKRKIYKAFHPAIGEVWMLHRVIPENQRSQEKIQYDLEVTPDFLEAKILEYQRRGYQFVSMDHVRDAVCRASFFSRLRAKPFVCVTLDDGYRDNLTYGLPVFKKHQVPFVIYVTTDFIDNKSEMWWYPGEKLALSMDELLQIDKEPLCTIGAHTLSHPKLDTLSIENQQREVVESKIQLEQWLGHSVSHFSYPHGAHTDQTKELAEQAGFCTIACAWGGKVRAGHKCSDIFRVPIVM